MMWIECIRKECRIQKSELIEALVFARAFYLKPPQGSKTLGVVDLSDGGRVPSNSQRDIRTVSYKVRLRNGEGQAATIGQGFQIPNLLFNII